MRRNARSTRVCDRRSQEMWSPGDQLLLGRRGQTGVGVSRGRDGLRRFECVVELCWAFMHAPSLVAARLGKFILDARNRRAVMSIVFTFDCM